MTATLRVMLDQAVTPTHPDLAAASVALARALVARAPTGCEVEGVVPAGGIVGAVPGLARTSAALLPRGALAAALRWGMSAGTGAGMLHSPTLLAPLVRHDRVHDNDQTVVSVWDLSAWESPTRAQRVHAGWQRAMLRRAARFADAVVVPSHAMAQRLSRIVRLGDRVRVIPGASTISGPGGETEMPASLDLPDGFLLLSGDPESDSRLHTGFAAIARSGVDLPVVVIDVGEGREPVVSETAAAAGLPERRVHVRGRLDAAQRAAVLGATLVYVATERRLVFPWRALDALAMGVPTVAIGSELHAEVIADGGIVVDDGADDTVADALAAALREPLGSAADAERFGVLAADRGRAFGWDGAAERVWQLHAEL